MGSDMGLSQYVDGIYACNLPHRTDRRASLEYQFDRLGITCDVVDGVYHDFGHIGCKKAHIRMLELAMSRGQKRIFTMEDDVIFRLSILDNLDQIFKDAGEFDILFFHHRHVIYTEHVKSTVFEARAPSCTQFQCIGNIPRVHRLLKDNEENETAIDKVFESSKLNVKITTVEYTVQMDDFSDIDQMVRVRFKNKSTYTDLLVKP